MFVQTHNSKNSEYAMGVETPNLHSGYASGFHLVQTKRDPGGKTETNCDLIYNACPTL